MFYVSIDYLYVDGQFVGVGFMEFQLMYIVLIMGELLIGLLEVGSYVDFCVRQYEYILVLIVDFLEVCVWIDFVEINNGIFLEFLLFFGDLFVCCGGDLFSMMLMDEQ